MCYVHVHSIFTACGQQLDSLYLGERSAVDMTRSELAALQVKHERSQAQVRFNYCCHNVTLLEIMVG